MTDEEKAEKYAKNYPKSNIGYSDNDVIAISKNSFLEGLEEGRKEGYEQGKNNERDLQCGKKNYEKDIAKLEKENAELNRDKTELVNSVTELKSKVAELGKQIKDFNLCGSSVAKSTYNEVVNENTVLKAKLQKVTGFVNSCSRSAVANMIKGILSE